MTKKLSTIHESKYLIWEEIDWGEIGKYVWTRQCEMYKGTLAKDLKKVHEIQTDLVESLEGRILAVRRVTQDNKGKITAGVDGVKRLQPMERLELADSLILDKTADPVRRIYIPKPGTDKQRPLGIPTIRDRAKQALALIALEPQWEAKFEANSYGFRPGRSVQDATYSLRQGLRHHPKYVFDADIEGCYDNIFHDSIISRLDTTDTIRDQIYAWLKAGRIEPLGMFLPTDKGTPQGGIISPLLANIALDGMEDELYKHYAKNYKSAYKAEQGKVTFVRYADDFVVAHRDLNTLNDLMSVCEKFLAKRGLILSAKKTKIVVTNKALLCPDSLYPEGLDFLGFHYQIRETKYFGTTTSQKKDKSFALFVTPSAKNMVAHYQKLRQTVWSLKAAKQQVLIKRLNAIIRGWSSYYRHVNSTRTFNKLDQMQWQLVYHWGLKRHSNKGKRWVLRSYFHEHDGTKMKFLTKWQGVTAHYLLAHKEFKIKQYVKIAQFYSPYQDVTSPKTSIFKIGTLKERLYKKQCGACKMCGGFISPQDRAEAHHLLPPGIPGRNETRYIWLLHTACHDQLHSATDDFSILDNEPQHFVTKVSKAVEILQEKRAKAKYK